RKLRGFRLWSRINSWYSASWADMGRRLVRSASEVAVERHPLQYFAHRVDLDGLECVGGERVGEQPPRVLGAHAAALHVEERLLVDLPHRRAVRALHVVGEDLELRLRVDVGGLGEQQRLARLLAVRLLRDRVHVHLAVEHAMRAPVEDALVQLAAEAIRLRVNYKRLVIAVLLAIQEIQAVERDAAARSVEARVDVRAGERAAGGEGERD